MMIGIVLWSDTASGKAVIWCEDHGDLAFYSDTDASPDVHLGAGDLVRFDLSMDRQFRFARNPQLLHEEYSSALAEALSSTARQARTPQSRERASAEIIPFSKGQRTARNRVSAHQAV